MSDGFEPHTLVGAEPFSLGVKMENHEREPSRAVNESPGNCLEIPGSKLDDEEYRVYTFFDPAGKKIEHIIDKPLRLKGGNTTHCILDSKYMVHCVPAPGFNGCILKWKPKDVYNWCQF